MLWRLLPRSFSPLNRRTQSPARIAANLSRWRRGNNMKTIHELLQECDALKARLSALRPLPVEALKKIEGAFAIEYTYESNRIEGNTLTLQETELVVNEGVTIAGKSMREHLEAINHAEAIDYIKDFARSSTEISERTIKEIHALILHGIDRGERRTLSYRACHDFGQHPHTAATVPYRPANGGFHVEVCRNGGTGRAPRFGSCISSRRVGTNPSVYRRKRAHIPSVDESIPIAQRLHARQPQRLGRSENRLLQGIGTITRRATPRCLSKACNRGGNSVPAAVSVYCR